MGLTSTKFMHETQTIKLKKNHVYLHVHVHAQCFESIYNVLGYIYSYPWPHVKHMLIFYSQRNFCSLESNNSVVTATQDSGAADKSEGNYSRKLH